MQVLVRHGETVGKSSIRYFGRTDVELSELGRAQMRAAASWLAARAGIISFAPVFASPLKRASEGARIIAGAMSATVTIDEFVEATPKSLRLRKRVLGQTERRKVERSGKNSG